MARTMKTTSRIRHVKLILSLTLIHSKYNVDAFSTPALLTIASTHHRHHHGPQISLERQHPKQYMSTVEVEYDHYEPNNNSIIDPTQETTDTSSLQTRSLSPNFLINSSILLIAIITILYQVLSIDLGITRGWTGEEIAARIPLDNWRSYTNVLNMAPLQTKAVTSATVYTIGDILSQNKEGRDMGELDRGRIVRSLLAGLIGHGPMSHVWYHVSEDFFDSVLVGHHWWDFIPKVVVDQTVFGPIWNNSYIILLGLMQLQSPKQIWSDMKRTTIPLIISGLKLWPFVHCITYGLIPLENRLLWVDAVEIVWVTILAGQANEEKKVDGETVVDQEDDAKR
ncbi:hypothetical protein ACHAXN_002649 [Cyclotella atomus]